VTSTWWDARGLVALVLRRESAILEQEAASSLHALATASVQVPALLRVGVVDDLDRWTARLEAWDTLAALLQPTALDDTVITPAAEMVRQWMVPARTALEIAGAQRVDALRIVSPSEELLTVAQLLGFRVAHIG
jgi:hypothetical protein